MTFFPDNRSQYDNLTTPTKMTLDQFWNIIELVWKDSPDIDKLRQKTLRSNNYEQLSELSEELDGEILENYRERLTQLDKIEFTSFIQHFEERIYHIDREEIHEYTDGSDDGFLYCRIFIVGMGRQYYNMIDDDPARASIDMEAEAFGFAMYSVYEKEFGEAFVRYQHHTMESCSNPEGWPQE